MKRNGDIDFLHIKPKVLQLSSLEKQNCIYQERANKYTNKPYMQLPMYNLYWNELLDSKNSSVIDPFFRVSAEFEHTLERKFMS